MSELPSGWIQEPLQSLVSLNEKLNDIEDDEDCGFVPMNLVPTKLLGKIQYEQKKWGDCKKGYTHFKDGDVLLAKITPCFENGKSVLVSGLPNGIGTGSTEYFVLRSEFLDSRYLHAFAKTKQFKDDCSVRMTGSVGHKRVPKDYLLEYHIPVAPLNEQIRIADKLDSVLAKVDVAQARLEKIPTLLKRFRQSVLAAATSGELTREWRAENKIDATYTTLGEAGIEVKTGPFGSALHKEEYVSGGIPVINPMHIRDGSIYPTAEMTITKDKFKELKAWKLEVGDVVIGRRGEMGRAAEITSYDADLLCGTGSMIIRSNTGLISSAYLCLVLRSPNSVAYFESNSVGSTMVNLNQKIIKNLNFHYPPSEEQKEIVRRVESLFTLADTVEKQYLETKKRIDRLTQSLLAKAFRGELVPQDPNDEPAAELLKRIQAERNAQPPVKNKRAKSA